MCLCHPFSVLAYISIGPRWHDWPGASFIKRDKVEMGFQRLSVACSKPFFRLCLHKIFWISCYSICFSGAVNIAVMALYFSFIAVYCYLCLMFRVFVSKPWTNHFNRALWSFPVNKSKVMFTFSLTHLNPLCIYLRFNKRVQCIVFLLKHL